MRKSNKNIALYLLLIVGLWAFCFVTLKLLLMPYSIAYTETGKMTAGYAKLVPWAHVEPVGATWPTEMTDAVVEVLECEKDNRE